MTTFAYDLENRLQSVGPLHPTNNQLLFEYDAQGTRVKRKRVSGESVLSETIYVGPHYEKRPDDGATSLYHAFGRLVGERTHTEPEDYEDIEKSTVRYFFADHLGSSSVVMNHEGGLEFAQTYRPYGMDFSSPPGSPSPDHGYKFTGQEQDLKWLYNYDARSYLPALGVFAQVDPIDVTDEKVKEKRLKDPQQLNPYAYVRGNPLKFIDPTGEELVLPDRNDSYYNEFYDAWDHAMENSEIKAMKVQLDQESTAAGQDVYVFHNKKDLANSEAMIITGAEGEITDQVIEYGDLDAPVRSDIIPGLQNRSENMGNYYIIGPQLEDRDRRDYKIGHELAHGLQTIRDPVGKKIIEKFAEGLRNATPAGGTIFQKRDAQLKYIKDNFNLYVSWWNKKLRRERDADHRAGRAVTGRGLTDEQLVRP